MVFWKAPDFSAGAVKPVNMIDGERDTCPALLALYYPFVWDAHFPGFQSEKYAVAAIRSGDDIKTVQENLGHHTAAFTLDIYGHVTEQMKRESAARMDAFISTLKEAKNA